MRRVRVPVRPSSSRPVPALIAAAGVVALLAACTAPGADGDPAATPSSTSAGPTSAAPTATPTPTTAAPPAPSPDGGATPTADEPDAPVPDPTLDDASPVLASATLVDGKVEMTGFVQGPIVAGGECRFELRAGSRVVRASSTSEADATSTLCPGVSVDAPAGAPTGWTARLVWVPTGATSDDVAVTVD